MVAGSSPVSRSDITYGGPATGESAVKEAVRTAVLNTRAGGMG